MLMDSQVGAAVRNEEVEEGVDEKTGFTCSFIQLFWSVEIALVFNNRLTPERSATELELSWNMFILQTGEWRVDEICVGEVQRVCAHAHKRRPVISKHPPDVRDRQGNHTRPSWEVQIHISAVD